MEGLQLNKKLENKEICEFYDQTARNIVDKKKIRETEELEVKTIKAIKNDFALGDLTNFDSKVLPTTILCKLPRTFN